VIIINTIKASPKIIQRFIPELFGFLGGDIPGIVGGKSFGGGKGFLIKGLGLPIGLLIGLFGNLKFTILSF